MKQFLDLIIFLTSVYGASYILTTSVLLSEPRVWVTDLFDSQFEKSNNSFLKFIYNKLSYLINCIICASVWVSIAFCFGLQRSELISISPARYDLLIYMMLSPVFAMYLNGVLTEEEGVEYD